MKVRWWLVSVLTVLLPSPVAAQLPPFSEPEVQFESYAFEAPIMPETEAGRAELWAAVGCNEGDILGGALGRPTTISWEVRNPDAEFVTATLSNAFESRVYDAGACLQGDHFEEFSTTLTLQLIRRTPAFVAREVTVLLWVEKPYVLDGYATSKYGPWEAKVSFTSDYVPIMEYRPSSFIQKVNGGSYASFSIQAVNFGNAVTRVTTNAQAIKGHPDLVVLPPAQVTLDAITDASKGHNAKELLVTMRTPQEGGLYVIEVSFEASSLQTAPPLGKNLRDQQSVTLSLQVSGGTALGGQAPAPGGVLLLAAFLAGLALVQRARKS